MVTRRLHPHRNNFDRRVVIWRPSRPSNLCTWSDPRTIATFVPGGSAPSELHGVAMAPWDGQGGFGGPDLAQPPMPSIAGLEPAAGAAVIEPDGRVWTTVPTNYYGAMAALPKGRLGRSGPQETAIREVWEETGLWVELLAWLVDVPRTTTVTRYYVARRIGGSPTACGRESQAVRLVPLDRLGEVLTTAADAVLVGR